MERESALEILGLQKGASDAVVQKEYERRREHLEMKIATYPTPSLKAKFRDELNRITAAYELLKTSQGDATPNMLPVINRLNDDEQAAMETVAGDMGGGAKVRPGKTGRKAPTPPGQDEKPDGARPTKIKKGPKPPVSESEEEGALGEEEEAVTPAPRPMGKWLWISLAVVLVLALGGGGAAWYFYSYVPQQRKLKLEQANKYLQNAGAEIAAINEPGPRIRALVYLACGLSQTGDTTGAAQRLNEAAALARGISDEALKEAYSCRLAIAMAAVGQDADAASLVASLKQSDLQNYARRGIACAQSRLGRFSDAERTIAEIKDDQYRCEALLELSHRQAANKDKEHAVGTLQQAVSLTKQISEPLARTQLICSLAEEMSALKGKAIAKPILGEASLYSAGRATARMARAQAMLATEQYRLGDKAAYEKKFEEALATAGNVEDAHGAADYRGRAEAYSAVAGAAAEAKNWKSFDELIGRAQAAAASVTAPQAREEAHAAIARVQAKYGKYTEAGESMRKIQKPENLILAAADVVHCEGQNKKADEAEKLIATLPAGEDRVHADLALAYGILGEEPEPWR